MSANETEIDFTSVKSHPWHGVDPRSGNEGLVLLQAALDDYETKFGR